MQAARAGLLRYSWSLATVAVAVLLSSALGPLIDRTSVVFFVAAVVVSAWLGGLGPSLLATVLGVAAVDYLLLAPPHVLAVNGVADLVDLAAFGLVAVLVSSLHHKLLEQRRRADAERTRVATILDSISDAFLTVDRDWRYVYLNSR